MIRFNTTYRLFFSLLLGLLLLSAAKTTARPASGQAVTKNPEYFPLSNVGSGYQTVNLRNIYTGPVIVCSNLLPLVSNIGAVKRLLNADSNRFKLRTQQPNNSIPGYTSDLHYLISDEGAYNWFTTSSIFNFFNRNNRPFQSCMADGICVGKISETRNNETLGIIVVETGIYNLPSTNMGFDFGGDNMREVGNNPPYSYTLGKNYTHGAVTQLAINEKRDDLRLTVNKLAQCMMDTLFGLLKDREDYLLLIEQVNNCQVTDSMCFECSSTNFGSEREAVLARIGSFVKEFSGERLQISGNGFKITNDRMQSIQDYLVEWGISSLRPETLIAEELPDNQINFEYDSITNSNN